MATVAASTDTPLVTLDPIGQVTFFMPLAGGTVTVTGKGGTKLMGGRLNDVSLQDF